MVTAFGCGAVALGLLLGACGNGGPTGAAAPQGESAPLGDIPDSTAFVPFVSKTGNFEVKVPEGWARRARPSEVTFTSKLNQIAVHWGNKSASTQAEIDSLKNTVPGWQLDQTSDVSLPSGSATLIQYKADSRPSSVTGQKYRLEIQRFDFLKGNREVALTLSAPVGADNVDAWRLISESFRWK